MSIHTIVVFVPVRIDFMCISSKSIEFNIICIPQNHIIVLYYVIF